jgi:hypothetical protein
MPFDVAGNFTRTHNFQQDRDNGIKILAARVDAEFDNFATGMNAVFFRDGRVPMQADLRMNINRVTGIADGSAASPALKFQTDASTGPYLDGLSRYAIGVNGTQRAVFTTAGLDVAGVLSQATLPVATQAWVSAFGYAPLASPAFTGTPTAPTPAGGDNSTKIATTAFVNAYAPLASPTFTGTPAAPTPATADNTTKIATTAYVQANLAPYATTAAVAATYAPKASPAFTGNGTIAGNWTVGPAAVGGVATATPAKMALGGEYSTTAGANPKVVVFNDATNVYGIGVSNGSFDYMAPTGAAHNFYVNGAQRFLVNGAGVYCPGWGDFQSPGSGTTGGIRIRADGSSNAYLQITNNVAGAQFSYLKWTSDGKLYHSGALEVQGNITSLSDARYKTNVRNVEGGLALVKALRPVRFDMHGKPDIGFIAQEVERVLPQIVLTNQDGIKSLDYGRLTAVLAAAVQVLSDRLDSRGL